MEIESLEANVAALKARAAVAADLEN